MYTRTSSERHPYSEENPCVGKGICLEHLLQRQPQLTRLDIVGVSSDNQLIYYYTDPQGFLYTSTEDSSEEARRDLQETMNFYGFTPPGTIQSRGKAVSFYSYYATLYGDLKTASVIVLVYHQYNEKVKGTFLLYKHAPCKELTKRSDLYAKACVLVEASKDESGRYTINGSSPSGNFEENVLKVISQLESALYDVERKLQNGNALKDSNVPTKEEQNG